MSKPEEDDWPVVHLYGPPTFHDEQIIACNKAGLRALCDFLARGRNLTEVTTHDGEGFTLVLLVTEETEKLPLPYTDTEFCGHAEPEEWAWLWARCEELLHPEKPPAAETVPDGQQVNSTPETRQGEASQADGVSEEMGGGEP